ncbi:MAG TPA: Ig-like domain-containing protein [Longimicrobium sp.]|nr:Ig-like domain-containing protein [Longimicrobium sp.]
MHPTARLVCVALAAALAAACEDPSGSRAGPPASLDVVSGNGQTGPAGAELPVPLGVRVTDERGRPVKGQLVNFRVTAGGGTVFASAAITNADGIAHERWTLGTQAGSTQTVEARAIDTDTGQPLVFGTFTATATAAAPASLSPAPAAGDTMRAGVAGAQANDSLRVLVRDPYGNPVPGVAVQWTATAGGGTVAAQPSAQTGADGIARAVWTLGAGTALTQKAEASVAAAGTVRFVARVATTMTRVSGDAQSVAVGTPVTVSVRLTDAAGQGVGGVPVTWQVTAGGGSVAPASSGGADGVASVQWTVGPTPGMQMLTATAGSLSALFTANAQPSATRTLVGQVPGTVIDVDGTRILWLDGPSEARSLKVRSRSGGADVTVLADSAVGGWLYPGGVLAYRGQSSGTLYEFESGVLTPVGTTSNGHPTTVEETVSVEGSWAAWFRTPTGPVLRRNLATGVTDTVAAATAFSRRGSLDVAADGSVAYNYHNGGNGGGQSVGTLWKPGSSFQFHDGFSYITLRPQTDGTNVLFQTMHIDGRVRLFQARAGGNVELSAVSNPSYNAPQPEGLAAGGWVAYLYIEQNPANGQLTAEVRERSPGAGLGPPAASERVSPAGVRADLEALAPDGTVVYRIAPGWTSGADPVYTRRYVAPPSGPVVDAGPVENSFVASERVIWRDGTFYVLRIDGSVYALSW